MVLENPKFTGLTEDEVKVLQTKYGKNELIAEKKQSFFIKLLHIISEPMFLLLMAAAIIFFILGEPRDGIIMLVFVIGIITIDVVQEWKTDQTLNALKDLSAPHIKVIRNNKETIIKSSDLVPGDYMIIVEGTKIPADGFVVKCSDLRVDESSLTGEAEGVWKIPHDESSIETKEYWKNDYCYAGTLVMQGSAVILVDKIGALTEYGKIGVNIAKAPDEDTPLQKQTDDVVKLAAAIAGVLFFLVCIVTWFNIPDHPFKSRIIESILSGITLSMAMIPEEFPVVLTVFLSMGAWRLAKKKSLVRKLPSVETLGAVSVLCVDKTGTITMNKMDVEETWAIDSDINNLSEIMGLACETETYDPMEQAMLNYCEKIGIEKSHIFGGKLISEYPFTDDLKMMGHVWSHEDEIIIAAKGSPESILSICSLKGEDKKLIDEKIKSMAHEGLRVIAVAFTKLNDESSIPKIISDCNLTFLGLVGLEDPPRETVKEDIATCKKAGIRVVMITGDNGLTASSIARKVGIENYNNIITGNMLNELSDDELREKIKTVNIFSRVIPEHKMRIVKAFKENGEIVAMTGDGVNDAPALKYADIGIAMGKRGSEVSREAADLILLDDNFSTIVDTVKDGRRIFDNIRKAMGYIFTIHIPIAFSSLLAPFLGVAPTSLLLLPLHVVLLELVIDPTCSIVLERQPSELNIMDRKPRDPKEKILNASILIKSIIQGIAIFAASFGSYFYILKQNPDDALVARSMGLVIIIIANLFLVQENSSDMNSIFVSIKRNIKDSIMWVINLITIVGIIIILYTPLNSFLKLGPLSARQFLVALLLALASVLWFEIVKLFMKFFRKSMIKKHK
ncbi:MAG: cation-translocating P-type ATPase [Oscillospiraceae bacterium]|nr:cation-translocating P-type ATPase [Oscillospiraceae bacterium]